MPLGCFGGKEPARQEPTTMVMASPPPTKHCIEAKNSSLPRSLSQARTRAMAFKSAPALVFIGSLLPPSTIHSRAAKH